MTSISPSSSLQRMQDLNLITKASEDQLDGFLRSKYTFRDNSPVSRFLFRPYWSLVSSKCPNFPPIFLLAFSLSFTLFNLSLLSYLDPSVAGHNVPRFVWFICAIFHLASFTCSGVDAAGRLARYEGDSVYSNVEYIDRVLESINLCMKTVCFLHVLGVGHTDGLLSHQAAFGFLVAVLACFLCQQWEARVTGVYRTSTFTDCYEMTLLFGFLAKAMTKSGVDGLDARQPLGRLILAFLVLGIAVSIGRTILRVAMHPTTTFSSNVIVPVISFVCVMIAQFTWTFSPDFPVYFLYICWSTGIVVSNIVTKWVLNQISSSPDEGSPNLLSALVILVAGANMFVSSTQIRLRMLMFLCSFSTVWHAAYVSCLAKDLLYRVLLTVVETFFRQAGSLIVHFFGKKESRSRK